MLRPDSPLSQSPFLLVPQFLPASPSRKRNAPSDDDQLDEMFTAMRKMQLSVDVEEMFESMRQMRLHDHLEEVSRSQRSLASDDTAGYSPQSILGAQTTSFEGHSSLVLLSYECPSRSPVLAASFRDHSMNLPEYDEDESESEDDDAEEIADDDIGDLDDGNEDRDDDDEEDEEEDEAGAAAHISSAPDHQSQNALSGPRFVSDGIRITDNQAHISNARFVSDGLYVFKNKRTTGIIGA